MYYDAIEDIESQLPGVNDTYDPEYTLIYTINSITDANQFCNTYNHNNRYNGLKLGQRIQINDGTYNIAWYIAGVDCESNCLAADGSTFDNGYGICLIPETDVGESAWMNDITSSTINYSYEKSDIHNNILPQVSNKLLQVLGSHLINRNVLLGNNIGTNGYSNSYIWVKSYAEIMSGYQITGNAARYFNKYDDGEGNYELPIYKFVDYWRLFKVDTYDSKGAWIRGVSQFAYAYYVTYAPYNDYIYGLELVKKYTARIVPMIYIR